MENFQLCWFCQNKSASRPTLTLQKMFSYKLSNYIRKCNYKYQIYNKAEYKVTKKILVKFQMVHLCAIFLVMNNDAWGFSLVENKNVFLHNPEQRPSRTQWQWTLSWQQSSGSRSMRERRRRTRPWGTPSRGWRMSWTAGEMVRLSSNPFSVPFMCAWKKQLFFHLLNTRFPAAPQVRACQWRSSLIRRKPTPRCWPWIML